jgi:hypothetical protein
MKTPKSVWVQMDETGWPLATTRLKSEAEEWEAKNKHKGRRLRIKRYDLFKSSEKVALGPLLMKKR